MNTDMPLVDDKREEPFQNKEDLKLYLACQDHTVSRETFSLYLDPVTELLVTLPRPSDASLPAYYESEEYISHTDSNRTLMDRVYQVVKKYSLKKKLNLINEMHSKKGSLLDIGCGTGDLLAYCENDTWNTFGVEPNTKALELAREKVRQSERIVSDLTELEKGKEYDVITMWHVLEHVPNLVEYIENLKSLLSPEGCLIIAVPNYKSFDAKHYKEFWAAYDVPRHLWHFSQKSIKELFSKNNFELLGTKPMLFDSFYVSLLSEKYKTGKSNPLAAFKTGLLSNIKASRSGEYSSLIYLIKNSQ